MENNPTSLKVVLLGDSGVGKTSLVTQYVNGTINTSAKPTIGAAFVTKEAVIDGKPFELLIWDTAGQEVYRGLAPMYYRSAAIAVIVYSVNQDSSAESVSYWVNELKDNVDGYMTILVCGNKIDLLKEEEEHDNTIQALAEKYGALYAETSALTGIGVERMFQSAVAYHMQHATKQDGTEKVNIVGEEKDPNAKRGCC